MHNSLCRCWTPDSDGTKTNGYATGTTGRWAVEPHQSIYFLVPGMAAFICEWRFADNLGEWRDLWAWKIDIVNEKNWWSMCNCVFPTLLVPIIVKKCWTSRNRCPKSFPPKTDVLNTWRNASTLSPGNLYSNRLVSEFGDANCVICW